MSTASALQRQQIIEELQGREYDLLVIGGGITGAVLHWMLLLVVFP